MKCLDVAIRPQSPHAFCDDTPVNCRDPFGFDIWIEGPSGAEPTGHQSINVGDPNGAYRSYSYGVDGNGLEGKPYMDSEKGGPIEKYKKTSPGQDAAFERFLRKIMNKESTYGLDETCRTWSQENYKRAPGEEVPAPFRVPAPRTPFRKITSSSSSSSTTTSTTGTGTSR